jgi:hypothetical protein
MNFQNAVGWFIFISSNPKVPESVGYRCNVCGVSYFFGDAKEQRAYCCNEWKKNPSGWFSKLPRVKAEFARGLVVLP